MKKNHTNEAELKKLMKLIYEKQREIEKYRRMAKAKERSPVDSRVEEDKVMFEHKNLITQQLQQNKQYLQVAVAKMNGMGEKISELERDLKEEEEKNNFYENHIKFLELQLSAKEKEFQQIEQDKIKMESSKENIDIGSTEKKSKVQNYQVELANLNQQKEQLQYVNLKQALQIKKMEEILIDTRDELHDHFSLHRLGKSHRKIKSKPQLTLNRGVEEFQESVREIKNSLRKWEQRIIKKEEELNEKFEKQLSERSIEGISKLINSFDQKRDSEIFENSEFKRNEEELLKNLEEQCNRNEEEQNEIAKEKLIELSEVKQTLRLTKDVNAQLFDELGRQQKIIKQCRQTIQSLSCKSSLKDEEEVKKIRTILGLKN